MVAYGPTKVRFWCKEGTQNRSMWSLVRQFECRAQRYLTTVGEEAIIY